MTRPHAANQHGLPGQNPAAAARASGPGRSPAWAGIVSGCAVLVFALGVAWVRAAQENARREGKREAARLVGGSADGAGGLGLRQAAEAAALVSAMKLVTVEVRTSVVSESLDESWRGDVRASVRVPVVLHYGTDLSRMEAKDVSLSLVSGAGAIGGMRGLGAEYVVRVPEPVRIATEVLTANESSSVSVGWLRFRSMGGEKELGAARRGSYPAAQSLVLTREQEDLVREQTRNRVEELVRGIVGPHAGVRVVFMPAGDHADAETLGSGK